MLFEEGEEFGGLNPVHRFTSLVKHFSLQLERRINMVAGASILYHLSHQ
jgi:hypothetical protein